MIEVCQTHVNHDSMCLGIAQTNGLWVRGAGLLILLNSRAVVLKKLSPAVLEYLH